ncbi:MAG: glycosyltransferase family 8 protein [Nostoc sp. DedQUE12a]|nr:glycosyltransferase family 8 protein [Nostoc sp. DedQUE12a]
MKEKTSILLAADDNYSRYCAVTILSTLENTSTPENFEFYILSPDISRENLGKIEEVCKQFNARVSIIPVDLQLFKYLPAFHKHFNLNNYSRLFGPNQCHSCDRLIYLDCDIIILADLQDLFKHELNGKPIGAVPHVQLPYEDTFRQNFEINGEDIYFNSGVMLIDTIYWRDKQYGEVVLEFCLENASKLHFADQDALNVIFWRNYCHLPGFWNVEARLYKEKLLGLPQNQEITKRMENPKIIHYTGSDKPWSSYNYVPMRHLYIHYSQELSQKFSWLPSKQEPQKNTIQSILNFAWSCFYFRASCSIRKIF